MDAQCSLTDHDNFTLWKHQFDLFVDDNGQWSGGGRLTNAAISYSAKHPVFLPRDHSLTALIVRDAHHRVGHDGIKETLTETRRKFWICKRRSLVSSLIHCCTLCRRFEGGHFQVPKTPPIPTFQVREEPPFLYTGVDFAGPLHVRTFSLTQSDKVWICLFTCLVSRAVHLDTVTDLTINSFIRCVR